MVAAFSNSSYTRAKLILPVSTGYALLYLSGKCRRNEGENHIYCAQYSFSINVTYLEINNKETFLTYYIITRRTFGLIIIKSYTAVPCLSFLTAISLSVNLSAYVWYVSFTRWTCTSLIHAKSSGNSGHIEA